MPDAANAIMNAFLRPRLLTEEEGGDGVKRALIPDPGARHWLAADGEWKPRNAFWTRRLRDGDVEECEPHTTPATPAAPDAA